jgi:hypothetical protein
VPLQKLSTVQLSQPIDRTIDIKIICSKRASGCLGIPPSQFRNRVQGKGFATNETRLPLRNSRVLLSVRRQISHKLKGKGKYAVRYAPPLEDAPGSGGMAP